YIVKKLEEQGHVIRGLKGTPKKGWTVDYWKGQSPQGTYELQDLRFHYDFSSLYETGTLRIKEIHVSRALYRMNDLPPFLQKQKVQKASPLQKEEKKAVVSRSILDKLIVEKINFANIKVVRNGAEDIDIKRFYIKQFEVDRQKASIQQAFIDAPFIKFQLWDSYVNLDGSNIVLKTEFELRKGLHRSILRTINGKLEFMGDIKTPRSIRAEAFNGGFKLNYYASSLSMQALRLTPSRYIRYDTNLTNITAKMRNDFCNGYSCLMGSRGSGVFYHNKRKFLFKGTDVWAEGSAPEDRMKLQLTSLWMNAISQSPIFSVSTDLELQDFVSNLYYSKTYFSLPLQDQKHVDIIRKDFFKYSNRTLSSEPKGALPSREDFNSK
ncbi:MAG: hypothetical protein IT287_06020, partial [Bdellovibrionaceae bacterium]|nr:hypothetical protein [Pseudobdellovibrionaceae bacterium]